MSSPTPPVVVAKPKVKKTVVKGPGRPPKVSQRAALSRIGVMEAPTVEEEVPQLQRVMELYYDSPLIIKKILGCISI
jgi:hypothetical protein